MTEPLRLHRKDGSCDFAVHGPPAACTCPANGIDCASPTDIVEESLAFLGDHVLRCGDPTCPTCHVYWLQRRLERMLPNLRHIEGRLWEIVERVEISG